MSYKSFCDIPINYEKSKQEKLDAALLRWFNQKRLYRKSITGPILKEQAMTLNQKIEESNDFIAIVGK